MNDNQIEVLKWWYGNRDYQFGVMLLSRFGKNKVLVHTLMKPGKEKFGGRDKLYYELPKAVGLNYKKMPPLPDGVETEPEKFIQQIPKYTRPLADEPAGDKIFVPLVSKIPLDQYPKVIRRLKYEYQEQYQQRSILHKEMCKISEENTLNNMTARANLLEEIKVISGKMDYLYCFIGEYEKNGTIPLEEIVWPPTKETPVFELPNDVEELRKLKKNLQTSNTKERNRLLYQQTSKAAKENPIPAGPKRQKYEMKIKKREAEILAIDTKIVELEN